MKKNPDFFAHTNHHHSRSQTFFIRSRRTPKKRASHISKVKAVMYLYKYFSHCVRKFRVARQDSEVTKTPPRAYFSARFSPEKKPEKRDVMTRNIHDILF